MPRTSTVTYGITFQSHAPCLLHQLPNNIHSAPSIESFKTYLASLICFLVQTKKCLLLMYMLDTLFAEIFGTCYSVEPVLPYYRSCVYDMCATNMDDDVFCNTLEVYATRCQLQTSWKYNNDLCRKSRKPNFNPFVISQSIFLLGAMDNVCS